MEKNKAKIRLNAFVIALVAVTFYISGFARAAEQPSPKLTLISNVDIFDGRTDKLHKNMHVLVKDNLIETVSNEPLAVIQTDNVTMIDGGVSSFYDPIDVTQYSPDEMKAIVQVAESYNTYVTVHAFTPDSIRQAIEAGVKCIEHGHLLDEAILKLLADKGVWLSMQPILDDEDAIPFPEGSENRKKFVQVTDGTDNVYQLAKKLKVKTAWGTDTLFDPELAKKQGKMVAKMQRWYAPHEILKMVTHDNAQLLKLSGPRDPYPGKLGVVEEGAYADLILVDGNPLENLDLVADAEKNFVLIMKDGKIYKNTLGQ
jgi:imidazolonepropionase-like amidohydrolase